MELKSYAKINLGLHVHKKRKDGFHNLTTIFQEINLFDTINIREAKNFSCSTNLLSIKEKENFGTIAYTLIIVGLFYNAIGAITLGLLTNINWNILPVLFIGSLLGGYIGAKISLSKSNRVIKIVYQVITITVGVSLIH